MTAVNSSGIRSPPTLEAGYDIAPAEGLLGHTP